MEGGERKREKVGEKKREVVSVGSKAEKRWVRENMLSSFRTLSRRSDRQEIV